MSKVSSQKEGEGQLPRFAFHRGQFRRYLLKKSCNNGSPSSMHTQAALQCTQWMWGVGQSTYMKFGGEGDGGIRKELNG